MEEYGSYRPNENPDSYGIATAELSDITEEKPLVVYDEEEVKALWGSKTHLQLIKDSNVSQGHRILYAASICPDYDYGYNGSNIDSDYCKRMKKNRRFHASKNYWQTLEFLINLAHAYYIKDDKLVEQIYNNAYEDLREVEHHGKKPTEENTFQISTVDAIRKFVEDENSLKNFVKAYNASHANDINFTGDEHTHHQKAYKVMGVACHVIGDLYAHRTMAEHQNFKDAFKNYPNKFKKSDFKDWNSLEASLLDGEKFECRNIHNLTHGCGSNKYEDSVYFIPDRHKRAKIVIKKLINDAGDYEFRTYIWNRNVIVDDRTLYPY